MDNLHATIDVNGQRERREVTGNADKCQMENVTCDLTPHIIRERTEFSGTAGDRPREVTVVLTTIFVM